MRTIYVQPRISLYPKPLPLILGLASMTFGYFCPSSTRVESACIGIGIGLTAVGLEPLVPGLSFKANYIFQCVHLSILAGTVSSLAYFLYKNL